MISRAVEVTEVIEQRMFGKGAPYPLEGGPWEKKLIAFRIGPSWSGQIVAASVCACLRWGRIGMELIGPCPRFGGLDYVLSSHLTYFEVLERPCAS